MSVAWAGAHDITIATVVCNGAATRKDADVTDTAQTGQHGR